MKQKVRVAISLGSNLGDRLEFLTLAARRLAGEFLERAQASRVYETEPWRGMDHPLYLNALIVGESEWKPPAILNYLQEVERDLGRTPGERYAPRVVDLDLIAYGEQSWESPGVCVPHPFMHERDFVLVPMLELWPDWRHPKLGKTVKQLWAELLETSPQKNAAAGPRVFAPPLLDTTNL